MMNTKYRLKLALLAFRWFWTHSTKTAQECTYSIVARDLRGRIVGHLTVTRYDEGIVITRR